MSTRKIKETISVTTNGITITINIDYQYNKFDIVDTGKQMPGGHSYYDKKEFIFVGRGREYMNGWINICEAIQNAIKEASRLYDEWKKGEEEEMNKIVLKTVDL